jgi:hypothetical protein
MPRDFYPDLRDPGFTTAVRESYVTCRSCGGTGLVYGSTNEENLPSGGPWYNPDGIYPWTIYYPKVTYHWTARSQDLAIPGAGLATVEDFLPKFYQKHLSFSS